MSLSKQLEMTKKSSQAVIPPEAFAVMEKATKELKTTNIEGQALQNGEKAPTFTLPNQSGVQVKLTSLLGQGPLVISFYRGGWCPFCNLELVALQGSLPQIKKMGAQLLAITPEQPDISLTTVEKNELEFDILHDQGNKVAEAYGLSFKLSKELLPIYKSFGIDLKQINGDDTFTLPIPATYVLDNKGMVIYHFADADYTKRLDPRKIINALQKL